MLLSVVVRTSRPPVASLSSDTSLSYLRISANPFVSYHLRTLAAKAQKPLLSFHRLTHSSAKRLPPTLAVSIASTLSARKGRGLAQKVAVSSSCPRSSLATRHSPLSPFLAALVDELRVLTEIGRNRRFVTPFL